MRVRGLPSLGFSSTAFVSLYVLTPSNFWFLRMHTTCESVLRPSNFYFAEEPVLNWNSLDIRFLHLSNFCLQVIYHFLLLHLLLVIHEILLGKVNQQLFHKSQVYVSDTHCITELVVREHNRDKYWLQFCLSYIWKSPGTMTSQNMYMLYVVDTSSSIYYVLHLDNWRSPNESKCNNLSPTKPKKKMRNLMRRLVLNR